MRAFNLLPVTLLSLAVSAAAQSHPGRAREVFAAESAFAQTMVARNLAAFGTFVAYDAVFFGRSGPLRGKAAVVAGWQPLFEGPDAPFSWIPETVEVLASGTLAHSSGPVRDPSGRQIGTFNSIWRREADGRWRVVFDKGCSCEASEATTPTADSLAIVAASRAFSAAYERNDTAALAQVYADSGVLLPPGREVRGRAAIQQYFAWGSQHRQLVHAMRSTSLVVRGDLAVDIGIWTSTAQRGEDPPVTSSERYVVVWRRERDGAWRIRYDMWHRPQPQP